MKDQASVKWNRSWKIFSVSKSSSSSRSSRSSKSDKALKERLGMAEL